MYEIENTSCVRIVMKANTVSRTEIESWDTASSLIRVTGGVYICKCSVISDEYKCKTNHAFVYDSHFKPLHQ